MARQYQLPEGAFLLEVGNSRQWQSPEGPMVLEPRDPGREGGGSPAVLDSILGTIFEDYFE